MRNAKHSQPAQITRQIKAWRLAGLQNNGKSQQEENKTIYKEDDLAVKLEKIREGDYIVYLFI